MAAATEQVINREASVPVVYRCSQCGHCMIYHVPLSVKQPKIEEKRAKFIENADKGNYKDLDIKHACTKCGKVEDWSRYNPKALASWTAWIFILGIFAFLGFLAGWVPLPILMFFVSAFVHLLIINGIINGAVNKHVKKMDRKNLPIAAADLETLKQKFEKTFPGEKLNFGEH